MCLPVHVLGEDERSELVKGLARDRETINKGYFYPQEIKRLVFSRM